MNIYDEHPFKVILDYGHNPAAVEAMCQLVERLDVTGRRLCVLAAPGDRRDEDIVEIGRIAAGRFDRYICRRDDQLRGRRPDEVPELLREALMANGVSADQISVIPSEEAAVDAALREAEPGDLLLIFGDAITRSWKQVIQFRPEAAAAVAERTTGVPPGAGPGRRGADAGGPPPRVREGLARRPHRPGGEAD